MGSQELIIHNVRLQLTEFITEQSSSFMRLETPIGWHSTSRRRYVQPIVTSSVGRSSGCYVGGNSDG
jgi:hypothetical protein